MQSMKYQTALASTPHISNHSMTSTTGWQPIQFNLFCSSDPEGSCNPQVIEHVKEHQRTGFLSLLHTHTYTHLYVLPARVWDISIHVSVTASSFQSTHFPHVSATSYSEFNMWGLPHNGTPSSIQLSRSVHLCLLASPFQGPNERESLRRPRLPNLPTNQWQSRLTGRNPGCEHSFNAPIK